MCFISIIIPTFNSAVTLPDAINSILSQGFDAIEVLIMDGLSRDNTVEIATSFKDDRIKVYSEKDNGVYDAMNKGIKKAKGDWLIFIGSDDTLLDNALNKFNAISNKEGYDIIYGNVFRGNSEIIYAGEFSKEKLLLTNICHQSIFFRKNVFTVIGDYDSKYFIHADYDHNLKWFFSNKLKHKFEDIMVARFGDGGLSAKKDDNYTYIRYWNHLKYNKHNLSSAEKLQGVLKELYYSLRYRRFKTFKTIVFELQRLFKK